MLFYSILSFEDYRYLNSKIIVPYRYLWNFKYMKENQNKII